MYQIGSPFGRVFGLKAILSFSVSELVLTKYAILGFEPSLVLDFGESYFRTGGTATDLVSAATHTRAGNATMVDSDGFRKWAPHNLYPYSDYNANLSPVGSVTISAVDGPEGPATAYLLEDDNAAGFEGVGPIITTTTGASYTYEFLVKKTTGALTSYPLFQTNAGAGNISTLIDTTAGTLTVVSGTGTRTIESFDADFWIVRLVYTVTTGSTQRHDFFPAGSTDGTSVSAVAVGSSTVAALRLYRSDLGGMVNNPASGDSYVPTTGAAKYLPRVGHHIWNGSAWVDEGYFHESEARTNLVTYSNDFTDVSWLKGAAVTANDAVSPDGTTNADYLSIGANGYIQHNFTHTIGQQYTISAWVKSYDGTDELFRFYGEDGNASGDFTATNEWQRFSYTYTATQTTGGDGITRPSTLVPALLHVYGAQVEAGSTPSSYIPTAGATVTRAADTMTIPAANLPWPEPVVIGPELVANGTFDSVLTGWATYGTTSQSVVSGELQLIGSGTHGTSSPVSVEVGKTYLITGTARKIGVGIGGVYIAARTEATISTGSELVKADLGDADLGTKSAINVTGSGVFVATGVVAYIHLYCGASADGAFDNIFVREINPLAVSIQMEGTMTYADEGGLIGQPYVWTLNSSNFISPYWESPSTLTGRILFRQSESGVVDSVISSNVLSPGINVPFNIASRHGSTFINGAVDGTALTANLTPTALPYLENTDMQVGYDFNGTIKLFRVGADDLTDEGIAEGSSNV